MRPPVEPVVVVQEELPVADDRMPHEQKRHGRRKWSKASIVYRCCLVALVEPSHHQPILHIGWNGKLLQGVVEETLCTIRRQIGEHNDDGVVINALPMKGLLQELRLVSVDELN